MSYPVIKWVKGNPYLYVQESYRFKGRVRTRTLQYLGRATPLDVVKVHHGLPVGENAIADGMVFDHRFTSQKPMAGQRDLEPQQRYELENQPNPPYLEANFLTLGVLEELEGKQFVARQFIDDLSRLSGLKPIEKELIDNILEDFTDKKLPVDLFVRRLEHELLPLDVSSGSDEWDHMQLPEDYQRCDYWDYAAKIYKAPFTTIGGDIHFGELEDSKNYFAHVRHQTDPDRSVRRILEIQSDLFQQLRTASDFERVVEQRGKEGVFGNQDDLQRVMSYRKHWWQRIIREEIRQAANDGVLEVHFPTGETAAYIEGFCSPISDDQPEPFAGSVGYVNGEEVRVVNDLDFDQIQVIPTAEIRNQYDWSAIRDREIDNIQDSVREHPGDYGWIKKTSPSDDECFELAKKWFETEYPTPQDWIDYANESYGGFHFVGENCGDPTIFMCSRQDLI